MNNGACLTHYLKTYLPTYFVIFLLVFLIEMLVLAEIFTNLHVKCNFLFANL